MWANPRLRVRYHYATSRNDLYIYLPKFWARVFTEMRFSDQLGFQGFRITIFFYDSDFHIRVLRRQLTIVKIKIEFLRIQFPVNIDKKFFTDENSVIGSQYGRKLVVAISWNFKTTRKWTLKSIILRNILRKFNQTLIMKFMSDFNFFEGIWIWL